MCIQNVYTRLHWFSLTVFKFELLNFRIYIIVAKEVYFKVIKFKCTYFEIHKSNYNSESLYCIM